MLVHDVLKNDDEDATVVVEQLYWE
jgi:hypothetical protein